LREPGKTCFIVDACLAPHMGFEYAK